MDITLRLSWILALAFLVGCGNPDQEPQDGRPASETALTSDADEDEGTSAASHSPPDAKETPDEGPAGKAGVTETPEPDRMTSSSVPDTAEPPGPPIEQWQAWAEALAGDNDKARSSAAEELDGLAAEGAVAFAECLRHESPEVRRCAAFYLIDRFDPSDAAMVQAFTAALSDEDGPVRRMALSVAKRLPRDAQVAAAPQLAATLEDQNETAANRAAVARLIATLEADARPVLSKLLSAMQNDPDRSVRSACLMAVSRVAEPQDAVTAFRQTLTSDQEPALRGLAAVRLGRLGPAAGDAAPDLANSLEDRDENVARKAADALIAIGAGSVSPAADKLTSASTNARRLAVFVLGKLGPAASPAVDELRKRLQDEDEEIRKLTEFAIRRIEGGR